MRILAVGPHPDDIETGCLGTLLKYKNEGNDVSAIITVCPSAEVNPKRNQSIVQSELNNSMSKAGIKYQIFNTEISANGRPKLEWNNDTVTQFESMLDPNGYDLIITTDPGDYHQDHVNTFRIVNSACRGITRELWTMEIPPYSHRNTEFHPTVFVDISNTIDLKFECLKCYSSYFTSNMLQSIHGMAQYRGGATKTEYAEAFKQILKVVK